MTFRREASSLPSRGGRQRQRTRSALIAAGQQLFAASPVEGVTVDQIVATADVAKGSFYNHFVDKDALADAVYDLIQGDIEFHIYSANQEVSDPASRTARALCTVVHYTIEHPERLQATMSLERRMSASDPLNAGLVADVRHGIEQGRMRGVDVDTGILIVIGLVRAMVSHVMTNESAPKLETLSAGVATSALRALGVDFEEAAMIGAQAAHDILGGPNA